MHAMAQARPDVIQCDDDVARAEFLPVYFQPSFAKQACAAGDRALAQCVGGLQRAGDKVVAQPAYVPQRGGEYRV